MCSSSRQVVLQEQIDWNKVSWLSVFVGSKTSRNDPNYINGTFLIPDEYPECVYKKENRGIQSINTYIFILCAHAQDLEYLDLSNVQANKVLPCQQQGRKCSSTRCGPSLSWGARHWLFQHLCILKQHELLLAAGCIQKLYFQTSVLHMFLF